MLKYTTLATKYAKENLYAYLNLKGEVLNTNTNIRCNNVYVMYVPLIMLK
jgi:hypothetical protein